MDELKQFRHAFEALVENPPFPWQEDLYTRYFSQGHFPETCDLPTGLGKTSVVAIWLIALANHPEKTPRRLVYVVNRRTVVDQTTNEVEKLQANLDNAGLFTLLRGLCGITQAKDELPLAISTLRGKFADNREWSADPSRPAVIVGTVDMIGSRLLFSGYGVGLKAKPLHAGFLAHDVLLVHDESHLEPAFQKLIEAIRDEQRSEPAVLGEKLRLSIMALSATSRGQENSFGLTAEEKSPPAILPDPPTQPLHMVWRRLKAKKGLKPHAVRRDEVAKQIALLARARKLSGKAILVFVRTIDDVKTVHQVLTDKKEGVFADQVQVLTGTLRGLERDRLAKEDPIFARFLLKTPPEERTVYLICTSAGEVGIDISADHMVCDLSTFESVTQRLGRVNRRGEGAAEIDLVFESDPDPKQKDSGLEKARWKTLEILQKLPKSDWIEDRRDCSPLALRNLKLTEEDRKAAFTPAPTILPTSDILFDAWALTTISPPLVRTPLPGRPPVEPYLHGLSEWQPPETHVAWRQEVDVVKGDLLERYNLEELLEDYPLKPHELLRDSTDRRGSGVFAQMQKLAARYPLSPVWIMNSRGHVKPTALNEAVAGRSEPFYNATILLPPSIGGLTTNGTLDGDAEPDETIQYDVADVWTLDGKDGSMKRRIRVWDDDLKVHEKTKGMRLIRAPLDTSPAADDDESEDPAGRRFWSWYSRARSADDDLSKTCTDPITWDDHTNDVTRNIDELVHALNLPPTFQQAFTLAARFHDLGKKRELWQRSIGNPNPTDCYAKSGRDPVTGKLWKPMDICPDYRHEFGSLLDVESEPEFRGLPDEMQDLVLHVIAAHHGRGRPHFPSEEEYDPIGTRIQAEKLAAEVPRRFARLQRKYGRWGLAYLESLLRAADYAASANPGRNP